MAPDRTAAHDSPRHGHRRPLLSLLVLGSSLLIVVSFVIPYFEPPFGGYLYMSWLSGGAAALGALAVLRRERGPIAHAGIVCTFMAAALFLFTLLFPLAYGVAIDVFMPN
jgi:hypothetical protein